MARKRDYAAEYRRRIARGKALGYSAAISRGHPRKKIGEVGVQRARAMLLPGPVSIIRKRDEVRHGYRPTYAAIRRRLQSLNLIRLADVLKGKKGKIPRAFMGDRHMIDDRTRDRFVDGLMTWGFTPREAYTLWFSP